MARMSYKAKSPRSNFGDSLKLTNCILESGATFNMTPEISDFIPSSLVETDEYIEVSYGHFITEKQTG